MAHLRVAVIGAGSWGTALAKLLGDKGLDVSLWAHRAEHVEALRASRENSTYLPGFSLPDTIRITADLHEAVSGHEVHQVARHQTDLGGPYAGGDVDGAVVGPDAE